MINRVVGMIENVLGCHLVAILKRIMYIVGSSSTILYLWCVDIPLLIDSYNLRYKKTKLA